MTTLAYCIDWNLIDICGLSELLKHYTTATSTATTTCGQVQQCTFKAHLKTELFAAAYDTIYNVSSITGASDLNSQHMALPVIVFDIDIDKLFVNSDQTRINKKCYCAFV